MLSLPDRSRKLDSDGLGERMLAACRAKEGDEEIFNPPEYTTIIMGALIMRAGGQISPESLEHLRALVPQVNCNARFVLPLNDEGFRSPGRAQFLAALDHYQAGLARSFRSPRRLWRSCFHCGQIESDVGHVLRKCSKCKQAWYCDKDCQRGHWRDHKHSCVHIGERRMINV
ncbi:hypothetical protein BO99DRAFT_420557 [Aspergillus violaceofuscus CBS 115571]|uniref:MYND-type domain-containing protein n=1 Tax=Aspergillus violaceofuscus (strain CBS 115571) TaxID=1450538 RepID=A0A2V5HD80_ASPV1|nr:hypothetical protein BO99DRAFT_420557 [Aspergillus violaceofuscus CBS 115571]